MLQTGRSDPHLHSQDVFFRPPNWDSGSLHSLPQGRRQWQIKLLTHLFRGVGARSTASWLKWWVRDSEGSCIIGAQCCGVMFAKQGPAMKRAEIKSSVLNSASVITCKKKKKNQLPLPPNAPLYTDVLSVYPAAEGYHVLCKWREASEHYTSFYQTQTTKHPTYGLFCATTNRSYF